MTPLHLVAEDTRVKIVKIDAGIGLVRQLKSKGIHVGDVVTVMHNSQGPLIMAKNHLRFALGRGMSHRIFVEEVQEEK